MAGVSIKTEIGPIDGTPEKRMFWSIISDYDLKTGLCELIDNALDIWLRADRRKPATIKVRLDAEQQIISVRDDVGGVRFEDLHLLLAPGGSKNDPKHEVIGIFGVGSKRAGIALGEQVEIKTRYRSERSLQIDITKQWLESEDWRLAAYEIPDIDMGHFSTLSRRFKDDWDQNVFRYASGKIESIEPVPSGASLKNNLPPLPKAKKPSIEKLKARNRNQIEKMSWTLGLVEAMGAIEIIDRQNLETKNRISLILLDSNFEIALKEYIVHQTDFFPPQKYNDIKIREIFARRHLVINEIKSKVDIPNDLLAKARHYYELRNKLIHERASVEVMDRDIKNYRAVVAKILAILFGLHIPKA